MKPIISRMKIGQKITARVKECVLSKESNDVIVSFYGDLLRIKNKTGLKLEAGQLIQLEIRSLSPLSFQVVPKIIDRDRLSLNISV